MTEKVVVALEMPKELALAAKRAAAQGDMSRPAWIRRAVREAARAAGVLPTDTGAAA